MTQATKHHDAELELVICDKHKDKQLELYYYECDENICVLCFAVTERDSQKKYSDLIFQNE